MDVILSDTLPQGVTLLSISSGRGQCETDGIAITCTWPVIPTMEGDSVRFDIVVPSTGAMLINAAAVTALEPDPQPNDNSSILETPVDWGADISVGMSAAPPEIEPGEAITYTLKINNSGPWPATAVRLLVPATTGMMFASAATAQGDCAILADGVRCDLRQLAKDSSTLVTIIGVADIISGALVNTATIIAAEPDPNPSNNSSTIGVEIQPVVDISVLVVSEPDSVTVGDELKYTVVIGNAGPLTASGVTLVNTMPSGVTFRLPHQRKVNAALGKKTSHANWGFSRAATVKKLRLLWSSQPMRGRLF